MIDFRFEDFLTEIDSFKKTAREFLDPTDSEEVLKQFKADLESLRQRYDSTALPAWEIPMARPLKTIVSEGKYEPKDRSGKHYIQASISCKWKIQPNKPKKKSRLPDVFTLTGLASVRVEFHDCCRKSKEPVRTLGSWRMELGTPNSGAPKPNQASPSTPEFPGCFFHVSVLGEEDGENILFRMAVSEELSLIQQGITEF